MSLPLACGVCDWCKANVRYRCVELAKARETSSATVEVECMRCGERFRMLEYIAAFARDYHAVVWCDTCRTPTTDDKHWSDGQ